MSENDDLVLLCKTIAEQEGWPWREPISVKTTKKWIYFGTEIVEVTSNAGMRGGNVRILLDKAHNVILKKCYLKR